MPVRRWNILFKGGFARWVVADLGHAGDSRSTHAAPCAVPGAPPVAGADSTLREIALSAPHRFAQPGTAGQGTN